ncbi:hypothetical protein ABG768_006606, partial [Culter alburnus]
SSSSIPPPVRICCHRSADGGKGPSQRKTDERKMKCFSRYLPYLFRPPNTLLSSSCHTEGKTRSAQTAGD